MNSRQKTQKTPFGVYLATTVVIFFLSLSAADSVGLVPNYLEEDSQTSDTSANEIAQAAPSDSLALNRLPVLGESPATGTILPKRLQISAIDLDLAIQNPDTRDINALDELLKNGPARYVDSAKLGGAGNMIIFAHSSHLPIVHNQMYKAFNRIPDLKSGDSITLVGADGKSYLYSVTSVVKADATDTTIDLSLTQGTKLTLVTCDTLTGKSARFILTAEFVGTVN